jgi:UDP-glucose 4-epimerase
MRVIIFGATGFIGFYLVNQLVKENFDVLAVDKSGVEEANYFQRNGIPFVQMDITNCIDFDKLPKNGVDAIVNLACVQPANIRDSEYNPAIYLKVNTLGTLNILNFCLKNNINKILYTISHRTVQGLWELGEIINENSPRAIKYTGKYSMFSISESAAVDVMEYYIQEYGIQGILLRLPPVYGYGHHENLYKDGKVCKTGFGVFIENAISGKPIEVWGDCLKGRDIIYVKDVVSAIITALKNNKANGLYNIASGRKLSLKEQVEGIVKIFSKNRKPSKIIYNQDKPNLIESFIYDISKAKRELGWFPKYSYEDMLLDYKKEMESGKLNFLLERKERMIHED